MSDFEDSSSYQTVTINDISREVQIVTITNSSKENYKKILSKPNETFSVGDVINMVAWNMKFLVTDIDEDKQVQTKGTIQLCNNTISFYSTTDSTLHSIPCIITDKITLSESENKYLTTVNNQLFMITSSTSITQQIKPNNLFKIGMSDYEVISLPDDISKPGVLVFKLRFSEEVQVLPTFTVEIFNGATVTTGVGTNVQLNCVVKNGSTILSPTPLLTYTSSNTNICTVSSTGLVTPIINGSATITVKLASDLTILDTISVTVSATQNNYTYSS